MSDTIAVSKDELDDFTDAERWEAEDLVRKHGPEAENLATTQMIEALEEGEVTKIISRLRLRRCIRRLARKEPYMRRLTDKIAAAVEQALEQGRVSLAQRLHPAFRAARDVEQKFAEERRTRDAELHLAKAAS